MAGPPQDNFSDLVTTTQPTAPAAVDLSDLVTTTTPPGAKPPSWAAPVQEAPQAEYRGPPQERSILQAPQMMGQNFLDVLASGAQGTSPHVTTGAKYNYQLAPPEAQAVFQETGVPQNQQTQVALRDPASGEYRVFMRNPQMAEGAARPLGRILAYGVPETGIPMVGERAVPTAAQNLLQDYEKVGVTPNVPLIGQSKPAGLVTNALTAVPLASERVRGGIGEAIGETGQAAQRAASSLGYVGTPEEAGQAVQSGIQQFAKGLAPDSMSASEIIASPTRASSFVAKSGALYDRFGAMMDPNTPVPVSNTMEALKGPLERFPTSPELGAQLTNPRLQSFYNALAPTGQLNFGELSELRSTVGRMLGEPSLVTDIPRGDLKQVYAGISSDMENAAAGKPGALHAFQQANAYYKAGIDRIDQLEPLLSGSPEKTFATVNSAAGVGPTANAGLLRSLQRSLDPSDWKQVGATIIQKMGEPTAGAKDVLNESQFSPSSFATNWNKISPAAKDVLFGANTPGSSRDSLEALARVAQSQKNLGKLANAPHSGELTAGALVGMTALEYHTELLEHPFLTAGAILGPRVLAGALMSPGFARWLYQMPQIAARAPSSAVGIQRALGQLDIAARGDPELAPTADRLHSALQPSQ